MKYLCRKFFFHLGLILSGWMIASLSFAKCNLDDFCRLIQNRQFNEAYWNNQQWDYDVEDPDTDFLYGMAALESGHAPQAVFAFERVLMRSPHHFHALYHLGRAYFKMGYYEKAKLKFKELMSQYPPDIYVCQSKRYLDLIEKFEPPPNPWHGYLYLNLTSGYDTNINASTDDAFVDVPQRGIVLLSDDLLDQESFFSNGIIAGGITRNFNKCQSVYAQGAARRRYNYADHDFDYTIYNAEFGNYDKWDAYFLRFPLKLELFQVGSGAEQTTFRQFVAFAMEADRPVTVTSTLGVSLEWQSYTYPGQHEKDAHYYVVMGDWLINSALKHTYFDNRLYYAYGNPKFSGGNFLVRNFYGVQVYGAYTGFQHQRPFCVLNVQFSDYRGVDPTFFRVRADRFYNITLGWAWEFTKNWFLQPDFIATWNNSNLQIYNYDRNIVQLELQYRFSA